MDTNSPKPTENGLGEIAAITVLRNWIDQVGGNQKIPQVLDLLAEQTAKELQASYSSPALDADTLRKFHVDAHGGRITDMTASRWLSSPGVRTWWYSRRESLEQTCRQARLACLPDLVIVPGGGRGNSNLYRLNFVPLSAIEEASENADLSADADLVKAKVIRYQVEPAKAGWWLRLIIGREPFRMRSWRGYLLMGLIVLGTLFVLAFWGFLFFSLRGSRPIQQVDLGLLVVTPASPGRGGISCSPSSACRSIGPRLPMTCSSPGRSSMGSSGYPGMPRARWRVGGFSSCGTGAIARSAREKWRSQTAGKLFQGDLLGDAAIAP